MTTLNVGTSELLTVRVDPNAGSVLPEVAWCSLAVVSVGQTPTDAAWRPPTSSAVTGSTLRLKLLWQATTAGRYALWLRVLANPEAVIDLVEIIDVAAAGDQPWADVSDVRAAIGPLRLPDGIDVGGHLAVAHAQAVARLRVVYPAKMPTFSGAALQAVAAAEASLAAARVWSALLANVDNADWTPVNNLRADAAAVLDRVVPGFDPSGDDPDGAGPLQPVVPAPVAVSSRGPYVHQGVALDPIFGLPVGTLDADPWPY